MLFTACRSGVTGQKTSAADAETFIKEAEKRYLDVTIKENRASWVQSNFITDDTETIAAEAKENQIATIKELADQSRQFDGLQLSPDVARKIKLLKLAVPLPAPSNPAERKDLTEITVRMESAYGKFEYCPEQAAAAKSGATSGEAKKKCLSLGDLEKIMAENRNPEELKKAWAGW
ncbi:MAG: M2 family metallopeptidase, partial [Blastocatellia bacterium]